MKILVTAGNTQVAIDQVRCITNIFTGRTGTQIALHGHERGHAVTLLTSRPELVTELRATAPLAAKCFTVQPYRTFEDLQAYMQEAVRHGRPDAVIHCAAVSDYRVAGVYAPAPETCFREEDGSWDRSGAGLPALRDVSAGKVRSDRPELWLRLVRTPKLVDLIRSAWAFRGILVKFKLEVGVSEEQLLETAERSRVHSAADVMVANTLEGSQAWAYLGPRAGKYECVSRQDLAPRLLDAVEHLCRERGHG
ncbi:MAG TPA: phosphopantothenoylcysteine decarboxylase [Gemmataceae bacterium]|jgi:phosphopantothenoylcysteine synthetase/decarboxylase|nr:phosphopantothenoylcysteine decarboxylase [Gemmataceae bacterium]